MPVGLQIVGKPRDEEDVLALAAALQWGQTGVRPGSDPVR